jgi:hypothetical protein
MKSEVFMLNRGIIKHFIFTWQCLAIFLVFPLWGIPEEIVQEAQKSYQQGEKALTYKERKLAFNRALFLYSSLEQEITPSASLDQALADTYFQLGEYAWAILYYQRALKKHSPNTLLLAHFEKAQHKLGLPNSSDINPNPLAAFFLALSKQFQLFFWVILMTFLAFSAAIWLPYPWIYKLGISGAILLFFLLGNFLFFYYSILLEGIIVKTTGFYRAPDWNQPQLTHQPLLAGSKVAILQMTSNEEWLKVANSTGMIGYVPTTSVRPI